MVVGIVRRRVVVFEFPVSDVVAVFVGSAALLNGVVLLRAVSCI